MLSSIRNQFVISFDSFKRQSHQFKKSNLKSLKKFEIIYKNFKNTYLLENQRFHFFTNLKSFNKFSQKMHDLLSKVKMLTFNLINKKELERARFNQELEAWSNTSPITNRKKEACRRIQRAYELNQRSLNLKNLNLTALPSVIGQLKKLEVIYLQNNRLQTLPTEITKLKNLTILNLSQNNFQTLPAEITKLTQMICLELVSNQIQNFPAEILQLKKLKSLILSCNQIQTLPAEIAQLQHLEIIALGYNHLQSLPSEMGQLKKLISLCLSGNPNLKELPSSVRKLAQFATIQIQDTGILAQINYHA